MVARSDWAGLLSGLRTDDFNELYVAAPIDASGYSWGGPFRAIASDGRDYFVKCLNACPSGEEASLVIETIVARAGALIKAPICTTTLIRVPEAIAGWEPRRGRPIQAGLAHASLALDRVEEGRPNLNWRAQDDNRHRHVGVYALYDWCFGWDQQWLYDIDNDQPCTAMIMANTFRPAGKATGAERV